MGVGHPQMAVKEKGFRQESQTQICKVLDGRNLQGEKRVESSLLEILQVQLIKH